MRTAGEIEDGLLIGTEFHEETEIGELVRWFIDYAGKPIEPELIRLAEQKDLPVSDLLSIGHGAALTAVLGKVTEILRARRRTRQHEGIDE